MAPSIVYPDSFLPDEGNPNDGGKGLFSMEAMSSEIRRHEKLLMESLGELCYILVRKQSGTQCGCWNPIQKQSNKQDCPSCFGTGYVGGYDLLCVELIQNLMKFAELDTSGKNTLITPNYKYIEQLTEKEIFARKFLVRFPPSQQVFKLDKLRVYEEQEINSWMSLLFPLKTRDIIVRPDGRRYRVKVAKISQPIRGIPLHQKLTLQLISQQDPIYNFDPSGDGSQSGDIREGNPEYEQGCYPLTVVNNGGTFLLEEYFDFFSLLPGSKSKC